MQTLQEFGITTQTSPVPGSTWLPLGMLGSQTTLSNETLILRGTSAPWILHAAKKLENIGKLPADWNSYGGLPLDPAAKMLTVDTLGWLGDKDLPAPAVVLGAAGTVQLEWRAHGRELEVELGKDGIQFSKIYPSGDVEDGAENTDLPKKLQGLAWWLLHG